MDTTHDRYLELLSESYPTSADAAAEIIRLTADLALPKGAEFFVSDIHGEYSAFSHILRNGSGAVRKVIDEALGDQLTLKEIQKLATLVSHPTPKTNYEIARAARPEVWYAETLRNLVVIARHAAAGRPLSLVMDMLTEPTKQAIGALLDEQSYSASKKAYQRALIEAIVDTGQARDYVRELCHLIQRLTVDHLHVVGDIYDRGPQPDAIIELLMRYPSIDIEWGNHDIVWMGASLGQRGCIAHVVRNCARYGNLDILADAYGINILPLATFALEAYADDPCVGFGLKVDPGLSPFEREMNVKIQKAMAIIQFKVEAKLIDQYPGFQLQDRKLLHCINWERQTVLIDGEEFPLVDTVFPTVDPADPYALTPEEEAVLAHLEQVFVRSEKLQRHMRFLLDAGSLYRISNGNLLLHACVPLDEDGSLKEVDIFGTKFKGKALFDVMEHYVRQAFDSVYVDERKRGRDLIWYMWLGKGSPLFAKSKMATFESYLVADKTARKENKNAFYTLFEDAESYDCMFEDFGLDPKTSHIICGHVPVKVKDGEDPVKAGGRVIYIDGGMSAAYQSTTGIAGYTLVSDAHDLILYAHDPFKDVEDAVSRDAFIHSAPRVLEHYAHPRLIADTDRGKAMKRKADDLRRLLEAYGE